MLFYSRLEGKTVVFRLFGMTGHFLGKLEKTEQNGVWLVSEDFVKWLGADVGPIEKPVLFLPLSSLLYLVAENEEV